jgi:superfamily II DNA or RNA helicase
MVHSLAARRYDEELYSYFGLVGFDEVHRMGAAYFSSVFPLFNSTYKVGLSATLKRKDGTWNVIGYHLGGVEVISNADALFTQVKIVDYTRYGRPIKESNRARLINLLAVDYDRNELLVDLIEGGYKDNRCILVVSERVEHVEYLIARCVARGVPEEVIGQYTREYTDGAKRKKNTKADLDHIKETKQLMFATYGMIKEGVSIRRLDMGIDATPQADSIQTVGRIRRPAPGKPVPVWFTIRDTQSDKCMDYCRARVKDYRSVNVDVIDGWGRGYDG